MVRVAGPLHRGAEAADDADGDAAALERALVLDVQLEITVVRTLGAARFEDAIRIAADSPDRVGARHAVPDRVHVTFVDEAGDDPTAGDATPERESFFVRPNDHFERVPRGDPGRVERLDHGQRAERPEIAVEVAAARHRVDMGAEEDRLQGRVAAIAPRGDVACGIDARLQAGGSNEIHGERAPCHVGVGIGGAADAVGEGAAGRPSEHAQLLDPLAQPAAVDAHVAPLRPQIGVRRQDTRRRGQRRQELTPGLVGHPAHLRRDSHQSHHLGDRHSSAAGVKQ